MQEMMKAMMQGQGGDQFDMEEMQRAYMGYSDPYKATNHSMQV